MEAEVKPARREFNVEVPKRCPACGSENVVLRVLPDANQARILCRECNNSYALPHTEVYYNKRVNSSLINWAHKAVHIIKSGWDSIGSALYCPKCVESIKNGKYGDRLAGEKNTFIVIMHWILRQKEKEEKDEV